MPFATPSNHLRNFLSYQDGAVQIKSMAKIEINAGMAMTFVLIARARAAEMVEIARNAIAYQFFSSTTVDGDSTLLEPERGTARRNPQPAIGSKVFPLAREPR